MGSTEVSSDLALEDLALESRVYRDRCLDRGAIAGRPDRRARTGAQLRIHEQPAVRIVREVAVGDEARRRSTGRPDDQIAGEEGARREHHALGAHGDRACAEDEADAVALQGSVSGLAARRQIAEHVRKRVDDGHDATTCARAQDPLQHECALDTDTPTANDRTPHRIGSVRETIEYDTAGLRHDRRRPQRDRVLYDARERATERRSELVDRAEIERDAFRSGVYDVSMRLEAVRTRMYQARARALREGGDIDACFRVIVGASQEARRHGRVVLDAIRRHEHELEAAHDGSRERMQKVQVRATRPDEDEAAKPWFRARLGQRLCPAAAEGASRRNASKPPSALLTSAMPAARSTLAAVTLREPLWQYVTIG